MESGQAAGSGDTCFVISALWKLRQEGLTFKVSLGAGGRERGNESRPVDYGPRYGRCPEACRDIITVWVPPSTKALPVLHWLPQGESVWHFLEAIAGPNEKVQFCRKLGLLSQKWNGMCLSPQH